MRVTAFISSALILAASIASTLSLADAARAQELQARVRVLATLPYTPDAESRIRHRGILPDGLIAEGWGRIQSAW